MKSEGKVKRTIALRFSDNFAPPEGTIAFHGNLIERDGYAWYGKLGSAVSTKVINALMENDSPCILLIHSGGSKRYWAYIDAVQHEEPARKDIPEYYRDIAGKFNTWFHVVSIVDAESGVMAKCTVASSGDILSNVSRHSMSPYFIIDYHA